LPNRARTFSTSRWRRPRSFPAADSRRARRRRHSYLETHRVRHHPRRAVPRAHRPHRNREHRQPRGGRVTPLAVLDEIVQNAKQRKLPLHLDGARIFNAAVALSVDVQTLTRGFDTVMFCLSKGLGAPVGSMLVGSAERMARARILRKSLGGGMRQVGVLAAAGLIALEEGPKHLHEDHATRASWPKHSRTPRACRSTPDR